MRSELANFLELAAAPKSHQVNFAVRVALLERNEGEYIWISNFTQHDSGLCAGIVAGDIHAPAEVAGKFREDHKLDCEF